ncbi:MAG: hypothetical protein U0894_17315 [Pirellulales bacterium]
MPKRLSDSDRDQAAQVVALFAVLVHARRTNHFAQASDASSKLEGLGVKVRFVNHRKLNGGASNAR